MKFNTRLLTQLLAVCMIPFTMLVFFSGWLHPGVETTVCAAVFILTTSWLAYDQWQKVRGMISLLHFGIFLASLLCIIALATKLFCMTEIGSVRKVFVLSMAVVPGIVIAAAYNNTIRRAETFAEEKERRVAQAGYKALWRVVIFLLLYSVCFLAIYFWGNELTDFLGQPRLEAWQSALHHVLGK